MLTNSTQRVMFLLIIILSGNMIIKKVYGAKRYSALIREIKAKVYQPDVVTDVKTSMRKVNRTTAFADVSFKVLKQLNKVPTSVELFRISGVSRNQLPLNITGDGCILLKNNYLVAADLRRSGLPDCPLLGDIILKDLYIQPKNIPNMGILGKFLLKATFMFENKLLGIAEVSVELVMQ
ncbi:uncharacterized protein LOC123298135 [Chrysoperla carnea]|uniref:uncharacterized protein LOC123298135 n=1 Tax=Chrysoperla carnea TaxID=189513 RepID=UPI001D06B172|nr:uncharacterized protein LOC123298135 [Chrysoperla carnea]